MPAEQDPSVTYFINVDLDLVSKVDLRPLVEAFGTRVHVLYCERVGRKFHATLETAADPKSADSCIRNFAALVRALPPKAKRQWKQAVRRDFNIGIQAQSNATRLASRFEISAATTQAAAAIGAAIVITIYSPDIRHTA